MRVLVTSVFIVGATLLLGACSGESPTNVIRTGSNTLSVDASVEGQDAGGDTFTTAFQVTVTDVDELPINDATVTISHAVHGATQLILDTLSPGTYKASLSSYEPGQYTLNITRGSDYLANARVTGPDIHQIIFPTLNDTIPLNTGFTTLWTRDVAAGEVEVETRDYGPVLSSSVGDSDDGTYAIPGSSTVRDDQRIRVTRINTMTPVGALAGSSFEVSIRNSIEPLVVM